MKKLLLVLISICTSIGLVYAQDDCLAFLPNTEGSQLITKSYDSSNNLLSSTTYTITEAYNHVSGMNIEIEAITRDNNDVIVDRSMLNAYCDDENFYFKMDNRTMVPGLVNVLSEDTQLVGSFLDYPDPFNNDIYNIQGGPFRMDAGEFTIKSKNGDPDRMKVSIRNRELDKNEKITTPAGDFDAAKIKFMVETYQDGVSNTFKGVEWYAVGAGVVRSEIYDKDDNLLNYTVLTTLDVK